MTSTPSRLARPPLLFAGAVVLAIVVVVVVWLVKKQADEGRLDTVALGKVGVPASGAGCTRPTSSPASGGNDHRKVGEVIDYGPEPPAVGPHYAVPAPRDHQFYLASDRPALATLVHNLEHGYTILWYDESVATDAALLDQVRAISDVFAADGGRTGKFTAAPWTAQDSAAFPGGAHLALTQWSSTGSEQVGVREYCAQPSGAAVTDFVQSYPYSDSPEPNAP